MALPTSGKLTLSQIQTEFGGSAPTKLSEYYAGGAYVPSGTSGTYGAVPSSGKITIKNFYGTTKAATLSYTFTTNTANASLNVTTLSGYVAGSSAITITVNSGVYLYSTSAGTAGLTLTGGTSGDTITLINNGYIMGLGGSGTVYDSSFSIVTAATAGSNALSLGFNTTVTNTSGYIGGGGGAGGSGGGASAAGGGGGAGGGVGAYIQTYTTGGTGGSVGSSGGDGSYNPTGLSGGGGGGRILPGTGGAGGFLASGGDGSDYGRGGGSGGGGSVWGVDDGKFLGQNAAGGGGGWGASGGTFYSGSGVGSTTGGSGGSSNNVGGDGVTPNNDIPQAGTAGGKAVALNGYSITWTGGSSSSSRAYGAVS